MLDIAEPVHQQDHVHPQGRQAVGREPELGDPGPDGPERQDIHQQGGPDQRQLDPVEEAGGGQEARAEIEYRSGPKTTPAASAPSSAIDAFQEPGQRDLTLEWSLRDCIALPSTNAFPYWFAVFHSIFVPEMLSRGPGKRA